MKVKVSGREKISQLTDPSGEEDKRKKLQAKRAKTSNGSRISPYIIYSPPLFWLFGTNVSFVLHTLFVELHFRGVTPGRRKG